MLFMFLGQESSNYSGKETMVFFTPGIPIPWKKQFFLNSTKLPKLRILDTL